MSTTMSDHQLATRVARELSSPEPGMHFGLTLVVGTLIAAPVLMSAAFGGHSVPTALAIYGATLAVVWVVAGLIGGALAMFGRHRIGDAGGDDAAVADGAVDRDARLAATATQEEAPHEGPGSVGSNGAH